jgi:DNA-binding response OmpR family regulator
MNLLLLEDEDRVAKFIVESLKSEGFKVHRCSLISEIEDLFEAGTLSFDVAIWDRMIAGKDSLALIPHFKQKNAKGHILILSAINTPEEKAAALNVGADDYLSKPFSFVELLARVRALLRRNESVPTANTFLRLANLHIDLLSHQASVDGKRLDLSQKEFQVLTCLLKRAGQVFNRFQLLDQVWDTQFDIESNVVEVTMKNLRRKLAHAQAKVKIESRRNVGYWIEEVENRET